MDLGDIPSSSCPDHLIQTYLASTHHEHGKIDTNNTPKLNYLNDIKQRRPGELIQGTLARSAVCGFNGHQTVHIHLITGPDPHNEIQHVRKFHFPGVLPSGKLT